MLKIGIIGGLTYASTAQYYLQIAQLANLRLGKAHCVEMVMVSIDPTEIITLIHQNNWPKVSDVLTQLALKLSTMQADLIVIPCNTLHKVATDIARNIPIPIINLIDCVGSYLQKLKLTKVGLLGSKFSMTDEFYGPYLRQNYAIDIFLPSQINQDKLHQLIFTDLCQGHFTIANKNFLAQVCDDMIKTQGCEGIILGCTELPLLLQPNSKQKQLIDTIAVHVEQIVKFALTNQAA
jgi:aspartate racemase